ncbi:MAG TPA: response regulator [Anaerolineae bacterium]|nr:response regulator [Anaerolineae bacterium]
MARILIVGDDADFVSASRRVLQERGYEVSAADNPREALALAERASPDLLLLDSAPGEDSDGVGLIEEISQSKRLRCVPVVLVTAGPAPPECAGELPMVVSRLTKPVKSEALLQVAAEHGVRTALIYSPDYSQYKYGPDHPLEPRRAEETVALCEKYDLLDRPWIDVLKPQAAEKEVLALFHDWDYLSALEEANDGVFRERMLEFGLGTMDCPVFRGMYDYSALVTGGTMLAANLVKEGRYGLAFNPAGGFHHAQRRNAEGFCYVNDIAIAIRSLLRGGYRVAYVDLDAHHGDGVQSAFYEDDRVLTISLHESGRTLFPWSGFETEIGAGEGRGYNINVPLPPQTDDEVFLLAFHEVVPAAISVFDPDIVFALIGADGLLVDPLSHLRLTNNAYAEVVKVIEAMSPKCVALGGGGYHMNSVTRAWCLAWSIMNGIEPKNEYLGAIGGMMLGTEYVEGGGLRDRHVYTTGPLKEEIRAEVVRVTRYLKENALPHIKSVS